MLTRTKVPADEPPPSIEDTAPPDKRDVRIYGIVLICKAKCPLSK